MSKKQQDPSALGNEINIREELSKYLRYWPLLLIAALLALGAAYLKLQASTPVYSTSATIMIKESKSGQNSGLAGFTDMGLFGGMNSNSIENEIGFLRSYRLMESVVKKLDLNIQYFDEQLMRNIELYDKSPMVAKLVDFDSNRLNRAANRSFRLTYLGSNKLILKGVTTEETLDATIGKPVDLGFARVIFTLNEPLSGEIKGEKHSILIQFKSVERTAESYIKSLDIRLKEKNSSLLELSLKSAVRQKAEDILNHLIVVYNKEAIEDKNTLALNTAEFINDRLMVINRELDSVETGKARFKKKNSLTNIEAQSQLILSSASEFQKREREIQTQLALADAMEEHISASTESKLLPNNLNIEESSVNESISRYNELVLERNRILRGSTEKNPVVIKLDRQIEELKAQVIQSLHTMQQNLSMMERDLNQEAAALGSEISAVPSKEKEFRGIERQQQIKEALYLYLLQKREENSLSLAVTAPRARLVDRPRSSGTPISPLPRNSYLTALLLGLGIPFAFLYTKNLLDNKVQRRLDIETAVKGIPIIGEAPKLGSKTPGLIGENDRSVLAEAFRIIQNNLEYLLISSKSKKTAQKILITSSIKGEGKTFVTFNLAMTLANTGKKVLIVGADLRNPQLHRYHRGSESSLGVSDYLINDKLTIVDLINKSNIHPNLEILNSGSIPPNPSELLRQEKISEMFMELEKSYDYILIDTAPVMLVVDTFLINQFADLTLYVVRANYTKKELLEFAADAKDQGKLSDVAFVLNNVSTSNFGYGNTYGYGYEAEKPGVWRRIREKAAIW